MAILDFTIKSVNNLVGAALLPAGEYDVVCATSLLKTAKTGGSFLDLKFVVLNGDYKNKYFYSAFNIIHETEVVRKIAREKLGNFLFFAGLEDTNDTDAFVNASVRVKVKVQESFGYGKKNEVENFVGSVSIDDDVPF